MYKTMQPEPPNGLDAKKVNKNLSGVILTLSFLADANHEISINIERMLSDAFSNLNAEKVGRIA